MKELISKSEADQENRYVDFNDQIIDTLGLSLHFGNHLTHLGIVNQLAIKDDYFLSFGDEITWILYYR